MPGILINQVFEIRMVMTAKSLFCNTLKSNRIPNLIFNSRNK